MNRLKDIWGNKWTKNLVYLAILSILFFTPVGQWIRIQIQGLILQSPSNHIERVDESANVLDFPFQFMDVNGNELLLSDIKGKPIFINFFASWCGPCLAEFPSMKKMQKEFPQVEFLFITREDEEAFQKFATNSDYDFPFYKQQSRTPPQMNHASIPASFILNSNGVLVFAHNGAANWSDEELLKELEELIQ